MIKVAFFDVDGTLLSHHTRQVCQSTRAAIRSLQEKGIACVVATGRHILQMDKLPMEGIDFDGYVTLNGQLVLDRARNTLYGVPIAGEGKNLAIRIFREKQIPALLMEKDRIYLNFINEDVRVVQKAITSPMPDLGEYNGEDIYQICPYFFGETPEIIRKCYDHCVVTRWGGNGGVDIIAPGGGKVNGLKAWLEANGIAREETIAFGDGENDLDMVQFAGIGVAMGNAVPEVMEVADYVTADIDDDGIAKALKQLGLI